MIRAAIDIGTGKTKLSVYRVAPQLELLFADSVSLPICRKHITNTAELAAHVVKYKRVAIDYDASEVVAIGTAAFRQATNGQEVAAHIFQATDVPVHIVSQEEEGELGLRSAAALLNRAEHDLISLDIGSGSFQICTKIDGTVEMVKGPIGSAHVASLWRPSQASIDSAVQSILPHLPMAPRWINNSSVVGLGSAFTFVKKMSFSATDIINSLLDLLAQGKEQYSELPYQIILIFAIASHYNVAEIESVNANGCTVGIALTEKYWNHVANNKT